VTGRTRLLLAGLLLVAAGPPPAPPSPLPLGELPPQVLAKQSCALFLWERATRRRVAMATVTPGRLRVVSGGATVDLAQTAGDGTAVLGFTPQARYAGTGLTVALDLVISPGDNGAGGAVIREGVIAVTGADGTTVVAPVAGLVGCN
jgi:hypothetical protein